MNYCLVLLLLAASTCFGQAPHLTWNVTDQNPNIASALESPGGIARTTDGGYIITGNRTGPGMPYAQNVHLKLDAAGNILWEQVYSNQYTHSPGKIVQRAGGGFAQIATYTESNNDANVLIRTTTATGALAGTTLIGNYTLLANESGQDILELPGGELIACGSSAAVGGFVTNHNGGGDLWLFRYNTSGSVAWSKSFGGATSDVGYAVTLLADGNLVAVGNLGTAAYAIKVNAATGALIWSASFPSNTGRTILYDVKEDAAGDLYACGITSATAGDMAGNRGADDAFVVKLNSSGAKIWSRVFGSTAADGANALIVDADGGVVMNGTNRAATNDVDLNYSNTADAWLFKVSSSGNLVWTKTVGSNLTEGGADLVPGWDGGYAALSGTNVIGTRGDVSCSSGYLWITKFGGTQGAGVPSGPILWLKADAGVTATGSNVTAWADQSGFNTNATAVTGVGNPQRVANAINGLPVLRFSGAEGLRTALTTGYNCKNKLNVFIVMRKSVGGSQQTVLDNYGEPSTNFSQGLTISTNVNSASCSGCVNDDGFAAGLNFTGSKSVNATYNNGISGACYRVVEAQYNTTLTTDAAKLFIDGVRIPRVGTDNANLSGAVFSNKAFAIGYTSGTTNTRFLTGDVAEIIVYPAILDGSSRSTLYTYLNNRYFGGNNFGATAIVPATTTANSLANDGVWKHPLQTASPTQALFSVEDRCQEVSTLPGSVYIEPSAVYTAAGNTFLRRHYTASFVGTRRLRVYFTQQELNDLLAAGGGGGNALTLVQYQGPTTDGVYDPADATAINFYNGADTGSLFGARYAQFTVSGGGEFYLRLSNGTLPLRLLSFTAQRCADGACLAWQTTDEVNTAHFTIEKATDGRTFTAVGQVAAVGSGANAYSFRHQQSEATAYYRLRMTDKDGAVTYSPTRKISGSQLALDVVPNPVRQQFVLNGLRTATQVTIVDVYGRAMRTVTANPGRAIDVQDLPSGIYLLRTAEGAVLRLVKE